MCWWINRHFCDLERSWHTEVTLPGWCFTKPPCQHHIANQINRGIPSLLEKIVSRFCKMGVATAATAEANSVSRYVDLQGPLHQRKVLYPKSVFDGDAMMAILFSQSLWFVNMGLRETHGPTKNPFWWSLAITPDSDEAHFQAGFSVTIPRPGSKMLCADHLKLEISDQASINDSGNPTGFLTSG